MAGPSWLSLLPKAARLFYPIALKGVSEGIAANSILRSYIKAGPGIRRTLGLKVVREIRDVKRKSGVYRFLKKSAYPNIANIPVDPRRLSRTYSYLTQFQAVTGDGEIITGNITISSWNPITPSEAEARAKTFLDKMPTTYGIESIEKVMLTDITRQPTAG